MLEKKQVRQELLQIRKSFSPQEVEAKSAAVCQHILGSTAYRQAHCIMAFLAFGQEISVDRVLQDALNSNKIIAVPYVLSKTEFKAVRFQSFRDLELDRYGIRSVKPPVQEVHPEAFDLLLVPGVGFSRQGQRMGMGAGYYDRFLALTSGFKLGVTCTALLTGAALPVDRFDQDVDALVTEKGISICSQAGK
ncbi:MAG: 5-formyltetrahydrofolate cyclo-ligase [Acidaminococcaceae bacterium]|jgi:5-formyltetrahydrofolate cyclo-ligase|nr:5-formyltetrahydrofolate cyclo-ligase [Acidaminococcaceae bacterium]